MAPWQQRLAELAAAVDPIDRLLAELESVQADGSVRDPNQLELFGTLLTELQGMQRRRAGETHRVRTAAGVTYTGTWEEIVLQMKTDDHAGRGLSVAQYMVRIARRSRRESGLVISLTDAESFVRGVAEAGLLEILP